MEKRKGMFSDGQLTIHMLVKAIQNLQNGIPDNLLIFSPPFGV